MPEPPKPLSLEIILSHFDSKKKAWVLQDLRSKRYVIVPDPSYPGRHPVRFFLSRHDAESFLLEVLEEKPSLRKSKILAVPVFLLKALRGIADTDPAPGLADSFVVHTPVEVYYWVAARA